MSKPTTLYDKIWNDHLVHEADDGTCLLYIDRHLVHEVTSPQAFEGLRSHRPQGSRAGEDTGRGRSQHPDHRPLQAQSGSGKHRADAGDGGECPRIRHRILQRVRPAPGHRARHRPRAGLYAARHHHRLRRQPHLHPRRVRRAGARHRHLRSRACAGDANPDPEKGQEHARRRRRRIARRRHRQGHHPRHHRRDRHRRRHRLCAGICRRRDPRAVDGRPHDGLQHVDRRRRPRRPDRARREGVRISEGPADVAEGRNLGRRDALLGNAAQRRGRAFRSRDQAGCGKTAADRDLGHLARRRGVDHRAWCRIPTRSRTRPSGSQSIAR